MLKLNRLLTWPVMLLFLMCGTAWAAADIPTPDTDAAGWAKALYEAITSKAWGVVAGLALVGIVYPVRRWGPSILKGSFGGLLVGFAIALMTTLGIALAAGAPFSWSLVASSLATAAEAAAVWEWLKDHIPAVEASAEKIKADSLPTARVVSG